MAPGLLLEGKGHFSHRAHLGKILLGDPPSPLDAQVQGSARVGHVSTLDHHALDQDLVLGEVLPSRVALTVAALALENTIRSGLLKLQRLTNSPGTWLWLQLSKGSCWIPIPLYNTLA